MSSTGHISSTDYNPKKGLYTNFNSYHTRCTELFKASHKNDLRRLILLGCISDMTSFLSSGDWRSLVGIPFTPNASTVALHLRLVACPRSCQPMADQPRLCRSGDSVPWQTCVIPVLQLPLCVLPFSRACVATSAGSSWTPDPSYALLWMGESRSRQAGS